ncbi:MAG TPA: hypothetical protein VF334_14760 [Polyangia bacterium]
MDLEQGSVDVELPIRVSARGVISGAIVGLALAAMLTALGAAIGMTAFHGARGGRSTGFAVVGWFVLALGCGAFGGGWCAAGASRALRRRDGVLAGIVTWALVALVSLSTLGAVMRSVAATSMGDRSLVAAGAWGSFLALLVALVAAIVGGLLGVSRERRVAGLVAERVARRRRPIVTSPQHTGDLPLRPPLPQT